MDSNKFLVEFHVANRGEREGTTKDGRHFRSIQYRGEVVDGFGHVFTCDAQTSFGGVESIAVHNGDKVLLAVSDLDFSGIFPLLKFSDALPLPSKARSI